MRIFTASRKTPKLNLKNPAADGDEDVLASARRHLQEADQPVAALAASTPRSAALPISQMRARFEGGGGGKSAPASLFKLKLRGSKMGTKEAPSKHARPEPATPEPAAPEPAAPEPAAPEPAESGSSAPVAVFAPAPATAPATVRVPVPATVPAPAPVRQRRLSGLEKAFQAVDTDDSGQITSQDLAEFMLNARRRSSFDANGVDPKSIEAEAGKAIMMADRNSNGQVDLEEFKLIMRRVSVERRESTAAETKPASGWTSETSPAYAGTGRAQGTYVFPDGDVVEGDFLDGMMHGFCTALYATGDIYEGLYDSARPSPRSLPRLLRTSRLNSPRLLRTSRLN